MSPAPETHQVQFVLLIYSFRYVGFYWSVVALPWATALEKLPFPPPPEATPGGVGPHIHLPRLDFLWLELVRVLSVLPQLV